VYSGNASISEDLLFGTARGGSLRLTGDQVVNGSLRLGDTSADVIQLEGNVLPGKNRINLGSSANQFGWVYSGNAYVAEGLRFGTSAAPAGSAGQLYMDGTHLYFHNGTVWQDLGASGGLIAGDLTVNGGARLGDANADIIA
jgi:hypothetical protein